MPDEEELVRLELTATAKDAEDGLLDISTDMAYDGSVEDLAYVLCILVWDMLDEMDISAKTFAAMLLDSKYRPAEKTITDVAAIQEAMERMKGANDDDE